MRKFEKSNKLEGVSYDVRGPVLEEAERMQEEGVSILKLNTGNPAPFGFEAPNEVIRDLIMNARESEGYSDSKGIFSARKAIQQYCQVKKFPNVTINDIYTGNGVSELITMCMQGLLDNGDEVLVPMPDYPLWTASVSLAGGNPVHYICDEEAEWYPDIADIKAKVTSRTKAIVIINPNNPTGALYPKELLEEIVEVARQNNLIIYSDEIYDRLVMDGREHIPIATLAPDLFVVTLNGLSKSHRVAGFRVGWMVLSGDKSNVQGYIEGLNMLSSMRLCSNVLSQQIIQTALGGYQSVDELLLPGGRIYEQREYINNAINDIPGLSAVKPKAAFYIFPKIDTKRFNIFDDEKFVLDFLHEHHILLVHGGGFNWPQPDHFRIVYLPKMDDLKTTAVKMREFLSTYRQQ
ncbi:pyridoxal phosphate-dependent aminotransferase [Enterococcus durans]|uniref:pyridoxal phosphate-dependent aminotransferase n=1 Tax=Enterococcus durans TaxID=53345 RepID=UPI00101F5344|nr:pyridoxal phosphate-dependent aminotransferase [Enterococcus durans]MCD5009673.1 pyridoxal phosphate-dependent aminotransferase [Enterococcus durans]MZG89003.1 aminotransferase class I/II-fold pyridoxal phosphate-dependent enzyme [Enterococcus durans]MZG93247.1 aminotransferase class I/II-fold pyridoxal phosphate-dependent enzyme [Enterococcus durans]MZH18158.1 aminotransferase class I/II-fold pyridoxal phosphate-dependent enzyme [Enterococcus durans]MZH21156.1 aminotransferase class I/II-f